MRIVIVGQQALRRARGFTARGDEVAAFLRHLS
jgi:hypothetical protein